MEEIHVQDLIGTFSAADVVINLVLSFALCSLIGWVYQITRRGASYAQSFVQTLVLNGMVVSVLMLVIGSSIALALILVALLSILRFQNLVKEPYDAGFAFFSIAIGMSVGTKAYPLAGIAAALISLAVLVMTRFDWYARQAISQLLKIRVPNNVGFDALFDAVLVKYTTTYELVRMDTAQSGTLTELTYRIALKSGGNMQDFLAEIKELNGNHRVALIASYNGSDL